MEAILPPLEAQLTLVRLVFPDFPPADLEGRLNQVGLYGCSLCPHEEALHMLALADLAERSQWSAFELASVTEIFERRPSRHEALAFWLMSELWVAQTGLTSPDLLAQQAAAIGLQGDTWARAFSSLVEAGICESRSHVEAPFQEEPRIGTVSVPIVGLTKSGDTALRWALLGEPGPAAVGPRSSFPRPRLRLTEQAVKGSRGHSYVLGILNDRLELHLSRSFEKELRDLAQGKAGKTTPTRSKLVRWLKEEHGIELDHLEVTLSEPGK